MSEPNFDMRPTFDEEIAEVNAKLDFMRRVNASRGERLEVAGAAGANLAAAVYAFLDDPSGVGTDALQAAYGRFMGTHSAGFTRSSWEASRAVVA